MDIKIVKASENKKKMDEFHERLERRRRLAKEAVNELAEKIQPGFTGRLEVSYWREYSAGQDLSRHEIYAKEERRILGIIKTARPALVFQLFEPKPYDGVLGVCAVVYFASIFDEVQDVMVKLAEKIEANAVIIHTEYD